MRRPTFRTLAGALLLGAAAWGLCGSLTRPDEIAVKWQEQYEQVRKRYDSILPSPEPSLFPQRAVIAKFRFDDPVYGFTTPNAEIYRIGVDPETGGVDSVQLLLQAKPLPLNDVIASVLDLQNQLRRRGWRPFQYSGMRPIEDTPELRRRLHECQSPTSVWNAADKYQITIDISCRSIPQRPNQERYGAVLELGRPFWTDRPGE
jgi:hypothetical protein